jgi:hypothetical protein
LRLATMMQLCPGHLADGGLDRLVQRALPPSSLRAG